LARRHRTSVTANPSSTSQSAVPTIGPEEFLRGDEELLRKGLPSTQVAVVSTSALSVGVSQGDGAVCAVRARRLGIPVVKRTTGGLGIWHAPGDLLWSIVLPRSDPRVGRDFSKAYARLGSGAVQFLDSLGVPAAWRPPAGLPTECCLLSGRGSVLMVAGRTIGGAAQHLTRGALLHHGVLPYRLDPPRLRELFGLSPELVDRYLMGVEEMAPGRTPTWLAERLLAVLASELG
jgi:lipoate-protein ligase A